MTPAIVPEIVPLGDGVARCCQMVKAVAEGISPVRFHSRLIATASSMPAIYPRSDGAPAGDGRNHDGKITAIGRESWPGNLRGNSENGVQQTLFSMQAPTA
ncbi:hypothetical protein V1281_007082 [Nitrobacteraceae bacterium AZCC 2161]